LPAGGDKDPSDEVRTPGKTDNGKPAEKLFASDIALEVHIRPAAVQPGSDHDDRRPSDAPEPPEIPVPGRQAEKTEAIPVVATGSAHPSLPATPTTAPVLAGAAPHIADATVPLPAETVTRPHVPAAPPAPERPASPVRFTQEPPARADATQPLRTVSLEFAPDGAGDVRLRLSERAGEVHISLHSSDPSLSGRLHEGIHDLVGSLSTAGYDAEAWTPSQGRQNQRQPEESPKRRRDDSSGDGAESFGGMLQQPIQEIS
jgi:hypothetical protein